jgi:hypothetical protein
VGRKGGDTGCVLSDSGGASRGGGENVSACSVENGRERMRVQPRRREDVGATLAFQEESEPEGYVAPLRWIEGSKRALHNSQPVVSKALYKVVGAWRGARTPRSSSASSR